MNWLPNRFDLQLPAWVSSLKLVEEQPYNTLEERMKLVLSLADFNIVAGTGGPFAAATFTMDSGKLFSIGVNIVQTAQCSLAHAEIMALALAHQRAGNWDLSHASVPPLQLVSSAEPCAMCYGAIPWSGVRSLVYGARCADTERFGFDEGNKPADWVTSLQKRGVQVINDVLRDEAIQLFQHYQQREGHIYNPSRSLGEDL